LHNKSNACWSLVYCVIFIFDMTNISNKIDFIISYLSKLNRNYILICMTLFDIVITFFLSLLFSMLIGDEVFEIDFLINQSLADIFFLAVVFGPFIETFIFQFLIIETAMICFKKLGVPYSNITSIAISGIVFGISHSYSTYYILAASISGVLFAFFYLVARNHKFMNAFLTVWIIHTTTNFVGFVVDDWLGLM
jgi:hypothetical protein